ncbi:MAG: RNA methyltransferase [Bacteroidetes bacterium]|nr:RNA methyltransferase [Bacteroidota bacterium]
MSEFISSFQNPLIKNLKKLNKHKERTEQNLIVIEGIRECKHAVNSGFEIIKILYCSKYISEITLKNELQISNNFSFTEVSEEVFNTLVYRKGIKNCLAIAKPVYFSLNQVSKILNSPNPIILVIDSVEKPGNLGAMLRTCDAANVDLIIVTDAATDLFNPNCIRASLGAVFTQKVIISSISECINFLESQDINVYLTYLEASNIYFKNDFTRATAIVVGSEAIGINNEWLNHNFNRIIIPQYGKVDSMNVSNSAAVVLFEAVRQRTFSNV